MEFDERAAEGPVAGAVTVADPGRVSLPAGGGRELAGTGRDGHRHRSGGRVREVLLVTAAVFLYSLVRGFTDDRVATAFDNATHVISFERALGLFREPQLQEAVLGSDLTVDAMNAVYMAYWPLVIGTLAWLLFRHPGRYRFFRNALMASGVMSLAVFAVFPLAPPRFLPEYGFADTIAARSGGYRELQASALVNEYAAMPSLHVGWVLLAAVAIIAVSRRRFVRVAAAALPLLMWTATVLTGNHYIVDGLAGSAVVLIGLATAVALRRRSPGGEIRLRRTRPA